MTKQVVGTLVGGLILFFWQFLSWGPTNTHGAEMQYTDKQDEVLAAINALELPPGHYMIPHAPPELSMEDAQVSVQDYEGKNWARISVNENYSTAMGNNLIRGFVLDLISAFLLVWILMRFENRDFMTCVMTSLAIGFIAYLTIPYLNHIWLKTPSMGYLIDAVVQWGLVGAFLGWWLNRR